MKDDRAASYQRTSASLHRVRGRLVAERTALINQLRALMLERGITVPQGRRKLERYLPEILADERNGLGPRLRRLIEDARSGEASTSGSKGYNDELAERVHNEEAAKRLTKDPWDRRADGDRPCGRGGKCSNVQLWP